MVINVVVVSPTYPFRMSPPIFLYPRGTML
jgi:hypothetical protein